VEIGIACLAFAAGILLTLLVMRARDKKAQPLEVHEADGNTEPQRAFVRGYKYGVLAERKRQNHVANNVIKDAE
jgi:hypothetical protein